MEIIQTIYPGEYGEDTNLEIDVTIGETFTSISFGSGEPEDMHLHRDLSDAYKIARLLEEAYGAGRRDEGLVIKFERIKYND